MRPSRTELLLCVALACAVAAPAAAQLRTISGTVADSSGKRLANALVVLDPNAGARTMRADSSGRFTFERVSAAGHQLVAAWIGYRTEFREVAAGTGDVDMTVVLGRVTLLDTVHVRVARNGVFGTVIARKEFRPLGNATVELIGSRMSVKTGADGKFDFPDVKEGAYVVNVKRDGYQSRMLSVRVAVDRSVELALVLDTTSRRGSARLAQALQEFDRRIAWMSGRTAVLIPRHELAGHQGQTLEEALKYSMSFLERNLVLDDRVCLFVNGDPKPGFAASDYQAREVEAVEVIGPRNEIYLSSLFSRWPRGFACGNPGARRSMSTSRVVALVIWERR